MHAVTLLLAVTTATAAPSTDTVRVGNHAGERASGVQVAQADRYEPERWDNPPVSPLSSRSGAAPAARYAADPPADSRNPVRQAQYTQLVPIGQDTAAANAAATTTARDAYGNDEYYVPPSTAATGSVTGPPADVQPSFSGDFDMSSPYADRNNTAPPESGRRANPLPARRPASDLWGTDSDITTRETLQPPDPNGVTRDPIGYEAPRPTIRNDYYPGQPNRPRMTQHVASDTVGTGAAVDASIDNSTYRAPNSIIVQPPYTTPISEPPAQDRRISDPPAASPTPPASETMTSTRPITAQSPPREGGTDPYRESSALPPELGAKVGDAKGPDASAGTYFFTLLALFASLGMNAYLGWIAWDTYNRYQDLVSDMRHASRRDRDEREPAPRRGRRLAEAY